MCSGEVCSSEACSGEGCSGEGRSGEDGSCERRSGENGQRIEDAWVPWERRLGLTSPAAKDCK